MPFHQHAAAGPQSDAKPHSSRERQSSKDTDDLEDLLNGKDQHPEFVIGPKVDPLLSQYYRQRLWKMVATEDLRKHHADITTLQSTLQETAIESIHEIVSTYYGEEPVTVVEEMDFGKKKASASQTTVTNQIVLVVIP